MSFIKNLMIGVVVLLLIVLWVFFKVFLRVQNRAAEPPRTVAGHWRRLPNKQRRAVWIDEREQSAREMRRW